MDGLIVATIMAGIILILMGLLKLGSLIKFIPYTITTGFTSGIAITIVVGQIKSFLGLTTDPSVNAIETVEKIEEIVHHIGTINWSAVIVGCVCLAVLIIWPMLPGFLKKIPGSLVAVFVGIFMVSVLNMEVKTIGELYTITSDLPKFQLPAFNLKTIGNVLPDAFTIAILAALVVVSVGTVSAGWFDFLGGNAGNTTDANLTGQEVNLAAAASLKNAFDEKLIPMFE